MVEHQSKHTLDEVDNNDNIDFSGSNIDYDVSDCVPPINRYTSDDDDSEDEEDEVASKYTKEQAQFLTEAVIANSDIIAQRGESLLELFQHTQHYDIEVDVDATPLSETLVEQLAEEIEQNDAEPFTFDTPLVAPDISSDQSNITTYDLRDMAGDQNKLWYSQDNKHKDGGLCGQAYRALYKSKDEIKILELDQADHMLATFYDLINSTPSERERKLLLNNKRKQLYEKAAGGIALDVKEVPCNTKATNSIYMGQNSTSMLTNTPCPPVKILDGHVIIEVEDILDHMFARGVDFDLPVDHTGKKSTNPFNLTPAVTDLVEELKQNVTEELRHQTCYGTIIAWSDSFLLRFSRQRNNSVWLFVVRICAPPGKSKSKDHMVCLAIGPSKLNHDTVIAHFIKSIKTLAPKQRYWHKKDVKSMVNTSFGLVAFLADTPERNHILKSLHLGKTGKRSGYASIIHLGKMPYCQRCFKKATKLAVAGETITKDDTNFNCNACLGWCYESESNAMLFNPVGGTNYPTTCSEDNPYPPPTFRSTQETHIRPHKQSFEWMIAGVRYAFYEHLYGDWNKTTTRFYLNSMAINKEARELVIAAVEIGKKDLKENRNVSVGETDYIHPIWLLGEDFKKWIEAIMHLAAHGIIGSVVELMNSILKEHNLGTKFENFANPRLRELEGLSLDWCRVKTLPKKNWLAEDEFGFGRVMLYLYGQFFIEENLDTSQETTTLTSNLTEIKQLLNSCQVMLGFIMSTDSSVCLNLMDIQIKVFLQCCHRLCKSYYSGSVEEFWFAKANFISLLNLPEQIRYFGPTPLTIESVFESSIADTKPYFISSNKTEASFKAKMTLMYKHRFIESKYNELNDIKPSTRRRYGAYIYPSKEHIIDLFNSGHFLSGFQKWEASKNIIFVPYAVTRSTCKSVLLRRDTDEEVGNTGGGVDFAKFKILDSTSSEVNKKIIDGADAYCLLKPCKGRHETEFQKRFAIITHVRECLGKDGNIKLQPLCGELFSEANVGRAIV